LTNNSFEQAENLIVMALGASHQHVIHYHHRKGQRVNFKFMQILEKLLDINSPEVIEWTLRTVEPLGSQSLFFKTKIENLNPGIFSRFQKKWKTSYQLINYLEQKWNPSQN